jgi:hypothetical protein
MVSGTIPLVATSFALMLTAYHPILFLAPVIGSEEESRYLPRDAVPPTSIPTPRRVTSLPCGIESSIGFR